MRHMTAVIAALIVLAVVAPILGGNDDDSQEGKMLYNGIRLPDEWPPKHTITLDPMPVPYLVSRPEVVQIDVGRQLFVDDFLIEKTTLTRTFHSADYIPGNPVLKPDEPWEQEGGHPTAMVFSDGVWYDPQDKLFKMWYMGGYCIATCYARSRDGVHWEKPALDVVPGTNIVQSSARDSATVWIDLGEKDPSRRYKLFFYPLPSSLGYTQVLFSADGIHWGDEVVRAGPCGDRTTVFYNPFRKVWVYSIRTGTPGLGRTRHYREHADVIAGAKWTREEMTPWVGADRLDPKRPDLNVQPELYNLDAVAYESILLGLFSIWPGQPADRPKPDYVALGFSRDGFHWDRPCREPFIPVSERKGDWNWGNVQSAGGGCLVVGDKLWFYVSARAGVEGTAGSGVCTTGLATLRRDGFASMDANEYGGTLTTRPLTFKGKHLLGNASVKGELRVEVLDRDGNVIRPFSKADCIPVKGDETLIAVRWRDADDLSSVAGKPIRFRFHLRDGSLYSFWVSPHKSGASHGYVAAGGPGFTGPTDQ